MTDRAPVEVTNLDRYGSPALAWSRVRDILAVPSQTDRFFLGTVGPDGRPHAAGVGALWFDGDLYVVSGPGTRKSRNLAANPACTISAALHGIDLVFEGEATRVTDGPTLERLAALSAHRQVIAVDLQGHGRTADIDRPLRFEPMADDVAALIGHLGLASASVMGYSLGGGVALQTAIRHPAAVDRLVVVSTPHK